MPMTAKEKRERKELAKRLLEVRGGDKVIFHGSMVSVVRVGGGSNMLSWVELPSPGYVVIKVMRNYRRGQSHLACIPSANGDDRGMGVSREMRLLYVGITEKILMMAGYIGEAIIKRMHPPEHISVSMGDIVRDVGMNEYKIQEIYNKSVMRVAPEMLRRELFFDFRDNP